MRYVAYKYCRETCKMCHKHRVAKLKSCTKDRSTKCATSRHVTAKTCKRMQFYCCVTCRKKMAEARPSPIPSLCTRFTRAGIEWRR